MATGIFSLLPAKQPLLLERTGLVPPHKCWEPCTGAGEKSKTAAFFPLKDKHCAMDTAPQVADIRARLTSCANAETEQLQSQVSTVNVSLETLFQRT